MQFIHVRQYILKTYYRSTNRTEISHSKDAWNKRTSATLQHALVSWGTKPNAEMWCQIENCVGLILKTNTFYS